MNHNILVIKTWNKCTDPVVIIFFWIFRKEHARYSNVMKLKFDLRFKTTTSRMVSSVWGWNWLSKGDPEGIQISWWIQMISSVIRGGMGFANLWQDGLKQRRIYRNLFKQESIWTQWKWNNFHITMNSDPELLAISSCLSGWWKKTVISWMEKAWTLDFNCWFKLNYRIYIDSISDKLFNPWFMSFYRIATQIFELTDHFKAKVCSLVFSV